MSIKPFPKILIHLTIAIVLVLIFVISFFYIYLPISTKHGESITVPDLHGMKYDEAIEFIEKRSLRLEVFDSSFVPGLDPLTIISQNPAPMKNVKENRKIYITVTPKNAPKIAFPDVIDYSIEMVKKMLKNNGLNTGKIRYKPDLAENAVLEARINGIKLEKGDSVHKGSYIDLIVGDGRGSNRFLMPKIKGLSMEEAEYTILGSGLKIGIVEYVETDTIELDRVLKSYPSHENGSIVRLGDEVKLWVSGNISRTDTLLLDTLGVDIE